MVGVGWSLCHAMHGASSHPGGFRGELSLSWALQLSVEWGLGD